ncbi:MAG: RsmB/NOP family class I SAM-dependent RNA methyltransferase [Nitrososphaeria archaeon]
MSPVPGVRDRLIAHLSRYRGIVPDFDAFIASQLTPLKPTIRTNTLLIDPETLSSRLSALGMRLSRVPWHPWFLRIEDPGPVGNPGRTLEHLLGYYYVQELSSALPPLALSPGPGDLVLDVAAAPGSKTTQMAQMMLNTGTIVANDVDYERIGALRSNVDRLRITNVVVVREDGRRLASSIQFPKVLLDAPCSSEGIARRSPESVARLTLNQIRQLSRLQRALIRRAFELLAPGGLLAYSVCTFAPEEAELVVDHAVSLGAEVEDLRLPVRFEPGITSWTDERGRTYRFSPQVERAARVYPHLNDTGGMFIALLRKPAARRAPRAGGVPGPLGGQVRDTQGGAQGILGLRGGRQLLGVQWRPRRARIRPVHGVGRDPRDQGPQGQGPGAEAHHCLPEARGAPGH